jgi:hypothetical protein
LQKDTTLVGSEIRVIKKAMGKHKLHRCFVFCEEKKKKFSPGLLPYPPLAGSEDYECKFSEWR